MVRYCHNHIAQSNLSCTPDQDFRCFYPCEIIRIYHEKNRSQWSPIGITRLAEWWQSVIERDVFFYFILTRIMECFSCSYLIPHLYRKNLKKTSRKSWIRWNATWWRHFNITMTSRIDERPAYGCSFLLSLGLVRVCEIEISIMECFSCSYLIPHLYRKNLKKTSRKSWIRWNATWWRHFNITMTSRIDVRPAYGCSFLLSLGLVRVCEIEISYMGKNNGNPNLVCKKILYHTPHTNPWEK